jgi:TPR repeat protein
LRIELPISAKEREERQTKIPLLKDLANTGDTKSQLELAWEYAEGRIIETDFLEASRLFDQAALSGSEEAVLNRARFLQLRKVPEGLRTIRSFAAKGDPRAQFWLAIYYRSHPGKLSQLRSAVWYNRAHLNGSIAALLGLAGVRISIAPFYAKPLWAVRAIFTMLKVLMTSDNKIVDQVAPLLHEIKRR